MSGSTDVTQSKEHNLAIRRVTLCDTCLEFCLFIARSLNNKLDELGEFSVVHHFDEIAIN